MSLDSKSGVFKLPNEVLVQVFHDFVDKTSDHTPVVLTHVCQLWRQLAHATASLWTCIDLDSICDLGAKHHLAFAHQKPLTVLWEYIWHPCRQKKNINLDDYECIFSEAPRFVRLHLELNAHDTNFREIFDLVEQGRRAAYLRFPRNFSKLNN